MKAVNMRDVGERHPKADPECRVCAGRGWAVRIRSNDGRHPEFANMKAVERCDKCFVYMSDIEATKVAHRYGVYARFKYPCVLLSELEKPVEFDFRPWDIHPIPPKDNPRFRMDPDRGAYFLYRKQWIPLWHPITGGKRKRIALEASKHFIEMSDEVVESLNRLRNKKSKKARQLNADREFLDLLISLWHVWGEGASSYGTWLNRQRAAIQKKHNIYI